MKDDNPRGGREHMIMPSHTLTTRPVTVDDMINWLRLDGFNRGLVGWSTQFSSEEIFGCPSPPTQGQLLPESQKKAVQGPPPGNADASLCAALDRAERQAEQEKEIRRKIQQHRGLIPAAVREVERRLVTAGVPMEEVRKLGRQDAASSVFVKLGRLEQIQRPVPPPPARVRIQVVCDIYGMFDQGGLWRMDLYIPRNCLFDEFEDILQRHAYVKSILEVQRVQTPERTYDPDDHTKARAIKETKSHKQVLRGKYVRAKVWGYKIVGTEETGLPIEADGHWIALCDQEDFTKLMKVVVRDASKIALICHESTLERPAEQAPSPPPQWKDVDKQDLDDLWRNWESGTFHLDPIDWELDDWEVGGYRPIGKTRTLNGTVSPESESQSDSKFP
ncbi:hypothetical protein DTO166G4_6464 [Paecilomyces variotii]|nr:hypothetical protein DTO166G4_6464 [Paecilomyces variotii]KAJ9231971.1 hypothetical protein DTO166G5_6502 [Paecilomyces variotii]KAJ9261878.1 hypothetical protein DTO195F2_3866 [Paecilomyces variotii]KAJ9265994.1 hypothetical protein DTO212C5_6555 [Paecilomyces variotii]KAJ9285846.1 hypothetical protein DTO021C3_6555 [Paecilomyces variotii]